MGTAFCGVKRVGPVTRRGPPGFWRTPPRRRCPVGWDQGVLDEGLGEEGVQASSLAGGRRAGVLHLRPVDICPSHRVNALLGRRLDHHPHPAPSPIWSTPTGLKNGARVRGGGRTVGAGMVMHRSGAWLPTTTGTACGPSPRLLRFRCASDSELLTIAEPRWFQLDPRTCHDPTVELKTPRPL